MKNGTGVCNIIRAGKIAQEIKMGRERFYIKGLSDGTFSLSDRDWDGWGTEKPIYNSQDYDSVKKIFLACRSGKIAGVDSREKYVGKKVDIGA